MGNELSLARKEEEGQPVLLVRAGNGEAITTSYCGDKGKKKAATVRRHKRRKVEDTAPESEGSSEAEGTNVSSVRAARRRRSDKNRKQGRTDEGENGTSRRSAQELGVVFPGSYCDEAELNPHYWIEDDRQCRGSLYQCKLCHRHLWLPSTYHDAVMLMKYIDKYGVQEGYCRYLNRHRSAKMLVAKLQDLRKLEVDVSNKREFAKLADKILSDKEYDRRITNG